MKIGFLLCKMILSFIFPGYADDEESMYGNFSVSAKNMLDNSYINGGIYYLFYAAILATVNPQEFNNRDYIGVLLKENKRPSKKDGLLHLLLFEDIFYLNLAPNSSSSDFCILLITASICLSLSVFSSS